MNLLQEVHVSYENAQTLKQKIPRIHTSCEFTLFSESQGYAESLRASLDPDLVTTLENFRNDSSTTALIIRGLPTDITLPPTPYTGAGNILDIPLIIGINIALYRLMNISPVTYQGENDGRLFRDVVPKKSAVKEKSSYGSAQTLGMHVDDCHLPLVPETSRKGLSIAPEYLSLCGMRCDLRVPTRISFLDKVIELLDEETIRVLKQPLYELTMPDSFASHEKFILPILIQDRDGVYYGRFDKEYTRSLTDAAAKAFQRIEEALYNQKIVNNLYLQKGDFLIFKNQRLTHSREAFVARFDGTDRWLLRLFGVNSLERTVPVNQNLPYYVKSH